MAPLGLHSCGIFLFLLCIRANEVDAHVGTHVTDEQRLIEALFEEMNYDRSARPVYNSSHNVEVTFGFTLLKIMDMEDKKQVLVTTAWLEMAWLDERISWDPADYNGLKTLRIPADMLWLPDIVLYNNADDFTTGFMPGKAMVTSDGNIFWGPPVRLRSSCLLDGQFFPFDTQKCTLKFGSWTYPTSQVDILNHRPEVNLDVYVSNGEWQLTNYTCTRHETVYPGPGNVTYSDIKVVLTVQRRTLYFFMNILFSCIWLSILTLLDFSLPPDEGEKITLGSTVLLSYAFFMLLVANSAPPSAENLPLLGVYLTLSLAINCCSLSFTLLVLKIHHSPPHRDSVPDWVRVLVLHHLARLVRCQCPRVDQETPKRSGPVRNYKRKNDKEVCKLLLSKNVPWTLPNDGLDDKTDDVAHDADDFDDVSGVGASTPVSISRQQSIREARGFSVAIRKTVEEYMTRYLGYLAANTQDDVDDYHIVGDWKQVALVIDRFLFWIFFTITASSTLALLVIIPSTRVATDNGL